VVFLVVSLTGDMKYWCGGGRHDVKLWWPHVPSRSFFSLHISWLFDN